MPRTRDRRSARWPGTGEGYRNVEGHKFGFGAVNCTASVAAGARATIPTTEGVEGVRWGGQRVHDESPRLTTRDSMHYPAE